MKTFFVQDATSGRAYVLGVKQRDTLFGTYSWPGRGDICVCKVDNGRVNHVCVLLKVTFRSQNSRSKAGWDVTLCNPYWWAYSWRLIRAEQLFPGVLWSEERQAHWLIKVNDGATLFLLHRSRLGSWISWSVLHNSVIFFPSSHYKIHVLALQT